MISCSLYRGSSNIRNKIIFKAKSFEKLSHSNINFYFWQFRYHGIFTLDLEIISYFDVFLSSLGCSHYCVRDIFILLTLITNSLACTGLTVFLLTLKYRHFPTLISIDNVLYVLCKLTGRSR